MKVYFLAFIGTFCRSSGIEFLFHSFVSRGGKLISLGLSFIARWSGLPYLESKQGMCTGTAVFPTGQRTAEFQPPRGKLRTVMAHFSACFADGDAVFSDGEMIFIFYFDVPLYIQVDKGLNVVLMAVNVIGHRIMGRIQEPLADMKIRKESFHPEPDFQKAKGVMF